MYQVQNPRVTVTGTVGDDKEVTFEGVASFVEMTTDHSYEDVYTDELLDSTRIFRNSDVTKLTAKMVNGWKYTVKEKQVTEVWHTARVVAEDRTTQAFEEARKRAGAPEGAKMRFSDLKRMTYQDHEAVSPLDSALPIEVEFIWKENK